MKIVIAAASGNIGRRTAEKVIQAGAETVLLARNPEKLADLVDSAEPTLRVGGACALRLRGAIVHQIGSDDPQGLIDVTQQADALFWLTPPKLDVPNMRDWYLHIATAGTNAVRANGIARVVNISSIGAGAWAGQWTRNLMGTENLTLLETSAILSQVLDRSIEYVQVSIESLQQQFAAMGATAEVQQEMGDLFRALGDPDGVYATARTPEAKTPTTFEQFVKHKILPNLH